MAVRSNREEDVVTPASRHPAARLRSAALSLLLLFAAGALSIGSPGARAATPALTIVTPSDGSVVDNGTPVIVSFSAANFTLVQPGRVGQVVTPNEGYVNVFVDSNYVRLRTDLTPFPLALSSGAHTVRLQLVTSDGAPLSPDVSASVRITATYGPAVGSPNITIVSPSPYEVTGHGLYLTLLVANFALVEPRGQPNAPNEGHVQILVFESIVMELLPHGSVLLVALPDGDITITARLVNNDGSPLNPDAAATVPIHVTASSAVSLPLVFNSGMALLEAFTLVVLILRRRTREARDRSAHADDPPKDPGS